MTAAASHRSGDEVFGLGVGQPIRLIDPKGGVGPDAGFSTETVEVGWGSRV